MSSKLPKFMQVQQDFSRHIKMPDVAARPVDVDDRHIAIYRDLFFKNIMGFLSGAFPVLAEIMGDQSWQRIGREFFSQHNNKTPYFLEISREFLSFLECEYTPQDSDPDYLYELAHYEWLELYVDVEPESTQLTFDSDGDVLSEKPLLSPVVEGFLYQYPVHQISLDNSNPAAQPSALIVYRGRNDSVGFVETNSFTLQLLALLKEGTRTGEDTLLLLLQQNNLSGQQVAYEGGAEILKHWQKLGIIWGCQS